MNRNGLAMFRFLKISFIPAALIFIFAAATFGKSHADYNKSYKYAELKTWSFANSRVNTSDEAGKNPIWDNELRQDMTGDLQKGGFMETSDNPDFLVRYHLGAKEELSVDVYRDRFPEFVRFRRGFVYWQGWRGATEVLATPYDETTLVMDVVDARTNKLVWRGYDTKTIDLSKTDKGLDKSASQLTKLFEKDVKKAEKHNG